MILFRDPPICGYWSNCSSSLIASQKSHTYFLRLCLVSGWTLDERSVFDDFVPTRDSASSRHLDDRVRPVHALKQSVMLHAKCRNHYRRALRQVLDSIHVRKSECPKRK